MTLYAQLHLVHLVFMAAMVGRAGVPPHARLGGMAIAAYAAFSYFVWFTAWPLPYLAIAHLALGLGFVITSQTRAGVAIAGLMLCMVMVDFIAFQGLLSLTAYAHVKGVVAHLAMALVWLSIWMEKAYDRLDDDILGGDYRRR